MRGSTRLIAAALVAAFVLPMLTLGLSSVFADGSTVSCVTTNVCGASGGGGVSLSGANTWTGAQSFPDDKFLVVGSADATKKVQLEVDGLTTATTRTLTPQDASYTLAGINITQAFTQAQSFQPSGQSAIQVDPNKWILLNGAGYPGFIYSTVQTPDAGVFLTGPASNSWIFAEGGDESFDFAHAQQTNPTLYIHSAAQSTTQWTGITHDGTNGVITAGTGGVRVFHPLAGSTAAAIASGFGSSPAIAGGDAAGRVTVGTGGVASTGAITFATAYAIAPSCVANDETTTLLVKATATTSTLTITSATPWGAADKLAYICVGY